MEGTKDYISIPKPNGYQSLHASLIGPQGVPIEVQIQTEYMNKIAKIGVSEHWIHKEKKQEKKEPKGKYPYTEMNTEPARGIEKFKW